MRWISGLFLLFLLDGCGCYDFSGTRIPEDIRSFSVDLFSKDAALASPQSSIVFTEKLKTKFQSNSKLKLVTSNGDYHFSGSIKDYRVEAASIGQNTGAEQNQFTIVIAVKFASEAHPEKNFEKDFSQNAVFNASESFSSKEEQLSGEIFDKIVQQIFAEVALDW